MECGLARSFVLKEQEYRFELCRKPEQSMGPVTVDHWWMPVTPLYGQRQVGTPPAHNHSEILRLYWAAVADQDATDVRDAQERFLLAALVPKVRVEGSRTVFADAFLKKSPPQQQKSEIDALESMLAGSSLEQLTRAEFHVQSLNALGRTEFPPGMQAIYNRLTRELLDGPCQRLAAGKIEAALSEVTQNWERLMRTIGRRAGHIEEKIALDVLSYEARAAFHHCYSLAWCVLIPLLEGSERFGITTAAFLRFWHTDWIDSQTKTSLFHGHVFGLHPGTGLFMLTKTGPQLLGEWLSKPESADALGRLLNGLLVALFDYSRRREEAAADRKKL